MGYINGTSLKSHLAALLRWHYIALLIGQNLVENAKIQKFKCDILGDFQTLWSFTAQSSTDAFLPSNPTAS